MQTRTAEGTSTSIPGHGGRREWSWTPALLEAPVQHPDLAPVYRAWNRRRRGHDLPSARDFTFDDLAPWLGTVSIVRQTAGDFELDLLGCSLTNQAGEEISRIRLSESRSGPVGVSAREMLETVILMKVMAFPCGSAEFRRHSIGWHGIVLPLAGRAALLCLFTAE